MASSAMGTRDLPANGAAIMLEAELRGQDRRRGAL